MMKNKSIEQAKNPLLARAYPALVRAAEQARKLAMQTGTKIVVMRAGRIQHLSPNSSKARPTSDPK